MPELTSNRAETQYMVSRSTVYHTGIVQVPVAGKKGKKARFIRRHSPFEVEMVAWVATCEGGPPVVPSPYGPECTTGLNDNLVFLGSEMERKTPLLIGGGTAGHVWAMSGSYFYGAVETSDVVRDYSGTMMPFEDDLSLTDTYFPADNFSIEVIDPTKRSSASLELLKGLLNTDDPGRGG